MTVDINKLKTLHPLKHNQSLFTLGITNSIDKKEDDQMHGKQASVFSNQEEQDQEGLDFLEYFFAEKQ